MSSLETIQSLPSSISVRAVATKSSRHDCQSPPTSTGRFPAARSIVAAPNG